MSQQSQRDTGPLSGGREVAHRLFATEYTDATYSYSESDEERAPNYVVTPTGVRANRLFVVGVLTEVSPAGESMLRARVADPTGAFVVYAGQYQPDAFAFLDTVTPPAFLAVTGKARTFSPDDADVVYTSIRPEVVTEVDSDTRDRWTVSTAERTLERIATVASALATDVPGDGTELTRHLLDTGVDPSLAAGVPIALEQYDTTEAYLAELQRLSLDTLALVAGETDAVDDLTCSPGDDRSVSFTPVFERESIDTGSQMTDSSVDEVTGDTPDTEADAVEATDSGFEADADGEDEFDELDSDEFDPDEFDPDEFELDAEVRDEVESEFGTEFSTAAEVSSETEDTDEPVVSDDRAADSVDESTDIESTASEETAVDESDLEAPSDPEEISADARTETDDDDSVVETEGSGAETSEDEEVDVTAVLLETMRDLDDGDGVDRSVLIERVSEATGVSEQAVSDAIQDALMSGQCYEPGSDTLKPI